MGSRAVAVLARDAERPPRVGSASSDGGSGVVYTRTGRPFFPDTDRAASTGCARAAAPLLEGWTPTGWCSTASCCPGRPRPAS